MERMGQVAVGAQAGGGGGTRQYKTSDQSAQGNIMLFFSVADPWIRIRIQ